MHRAFIATALAFSLHTTQAAEAHAATVPTAAMVQASLGGLPAAQQTASRMDATNAAPVQPTLQAANAAADGAASDGEQETSTAMLLAALLVLMAGIALRRRDAPQP